MTRGRARSGAEAGRLQNGQSVRVSNGPRVVILNGASSSGKTTLATEFRDQRAVAGDFWLLTGVDDYLAKLPSEWHSAGQFRGALAGEGIRFDTTAEGVTVSVGSTGRKLLRAYQAGVRAAARAGLNVVVDEVLIDTVSWNDWAAALRGLDATWVGVRCAIEVAEQREKVRGDRFSGLARAQTATVHRDAHYDFEIDTTAQTPSQALSELTRHLGF